MHLKRIVCQDGAAVGQWLDLIRIPKAWVCLINSSHAGDSRLGRTRPLAGQGGTDYGCAGNLLEGSYVRVECAPSGRGE
jgi:hypothetical protein